MNKRTKTTLRIVSIVLTLLLVLMQINVIDDIINVSYHFWTLLIAYAMLVFTMR